MTNSQRSPARVRIAAGAITAGAITAGAITAGDADAARRRRLVVAMAVGLAAAAAVPAVLLAEQPAAGQPQTPIAFLTGLMDDPKPANSADALAQGTQQLSDKQYEEALATLQQAKADDLDAAGKAQLSAALATAEKAAADRKAARAHFEQGEQALANGDNLGALNHYAMAKQGQYADAATLDKSSTQMAVALNNLGDLKAVYNGARADLEANNLESAKTKFWALEAVGFKAGLLNKSPADYLKVINEKTGVPAMPAAMSAAPAADTSVAMTTAAPTPDAAAPAAPAMPAMSAAQVKQAARNAYVAGREAYRRGDIVAAKAQFQRAVDLGYKTGWGEVGPSKMLVEIAKKESADVNRAAIAARDAGSTSVSAATPSGPTSDSPTAVDAAKPMDAQAIAQQPATPTSANPPGHSDAAQPAAGETTAAVAAATVAPPADTGMTSGTTSGTNSAMPATAAAGGTDLQATADAERVRHELNVFRAKQLTMQADQANGGKRYADAIAIYDEALKLDPSNASAQQGRATALQASGRDPQQSDIIVTTQRRIEAQKESIRFAIDSSLQESMNARQAGSYTDARRALIKAQSARDSDEGIFTREELANFDAAIRAEQNTVSQAEQAATAAAAAADRAAAINQQNLSAMNAEKQKRDTITALIKQSRQLSEQGRYADAVKIVDQILSIEPRNDYALGVRPLLEDRRQIDSQRTTAEKINRDLVDVLNLAEESRVPIPDLLVYPTDWPDISARRDETIRRERGGTADVTAEAILAKQLPELRFDGVPFVDVIEFLTDTTQANIFVNWAAIEGAGIDKNAPITTRLRNVKFSKVLEIVLDNASGGVTRLGYTIDNGVITISTQDDLAKNVATRTYDIRDLLVQIPDFTDAPNFSLDSGNSGSGGGGGALFGGTGGSGGGTNNGLSRDQIVEQIIQLIIDTIASDTWKTNGGSFGAVQELGGQLIVTQTPENQSAIADLLGKLRETRAIQVNVEARFLTVQRNFLEEVGVDFDFQFNVDYANNPTTGFNRNSDFSPVLVRNNSNQVGAGGSPAGFTSPGQLVTGLGTNLGQEAQNNSYGLSTSVSAFLDDFRASLLLRAVQLGQNATTLTAPKITLFNGQRAWIVVSTEQAYVSDLTPIVGQQAVGYDPTISYVRSGVSLDVQATVSADRKYVTMTVIPSLSRLVALRQFTFLSGQTSGDLGGGQNQAGVIQSPEVERTELKTTVSVPDRGTLLLGGQTLMGETERESGVPVLSKIPFLKRLFTNRGTAKDEQVLLILIKPTIIIQREVESNSFPLLEAQ